MKVGHICLADVSDSTTGRFAAIVEGLDRLAVDQHAIVSDASLARRLQRCPCVSIGPVVSSSVMAYCLMPEVDVVHVHDAESGKAGLLLTLTRSIPFVLTEDALESTGRNPLRRSVLKRAQLLVDPAERDPDALFRLYRATAEAWSELP